MTKFRLASLAMLLMIVSSGAAHATTYVFQGTITTCTDTCNGFAALDVGSIVEGTIDINTSPSSGFTFADVNLTSFLYTIFNPAAPVDPGPSTTTINPLPLIAPIAPIRESIGGPLALSTMGKTDGANNLVYGHILHEFVVAPFDSNGAWAIFTLGAFGGATVQVCLFAEVSGCAVEVLTVEGKFAVVPVPPALLLFGTALLGLVGFKRRS